MTSEHSLEEVLSDEKIPLPEVINPADWMTPREVADHFGVKSKTINRWINEKDYLSDVRCFRTLGGHRRFYRPDVIKVSENHENKQNAA